MGLLAHRFVRPISHFRLQRRIQSVKKDGRDHGHPSADARRFGPSMREHKVQLPVPDAAKISGHSCWALADESQSDSHPEKDQAIDYAQNRMLSLRRDSRSGFKRRDHMHYSV
jgi:hypothetical protein